MSDAMSADLLVNQIIGLMNQTERDVGDHGRRAALHKPAIVLEALRRFAAKLADISRFLRILVPYGQVADAEVIPVVVKELLKARASHIGQLYLGFLGRERGFTALQNVLFARTGSLDHLVDGPVTLRKKFVSKTERDVISHLGFLEGEKGLIIPARRQQSIRIIQRLLGIFAIAFIIPILPIHPIFSHVHSVPNRKPGDNSHLPQF